LIDPKLAGTLLYLAALLFIGYLAARRMRDVRDYFAGGKRFGFWSAAFSARATGESAWLLIGLTGMGAAVGLQAFWVVVGEVLGVAGAWLLMCRRFNKLTARYDSVTIPDYLESRFRDAGHAELPPSFLLSGMAGVCVSLLDRRGQAALEGVEAELAESRT